MNLDELGYLLQQAHTEGRDIQARYRNSAASSSPSHWGDWMYATRASWDVMDADVVESKHIHDFEVEE